MRKVLNYMFSAVMILIFSGIVAGWTMQPIAVNQSTESVTSSTGAEQLYSIDSIHEWMFMRQSENSNALAKSRVNIFKYSVNLLPAKPVNRLMQTAREGLLAHTGATEISHSSKEHIYYYIFNLRRIII